MRRSLSDRPRQTDKLAIGRPSVQDYADLQGHSLLKTTLGYVVTLLYLAHNSDLQSLQNHRYAVHLGTCSIHDPKILSLRSYDQIRLENSTEGGSFRKVAHNVYFQQFPDVESADHARDVEVLDAIEAIVHPHGEALIKLYFRIVHPSFPILHKKVRKFYAIRSSTDTTKRSISRNMPDHTENLFHHYLQQSTYRLSIGGLTALN